MEFALGAAIIVLIFFAATLRWWFGQAQAREAEVPEQARRVTARNVRFLDLFGLALLAIGLLAYAAQRA
ncbi:hypothetical protein HJG53_15035 [Sphingomonas sp. ID1715]|uniref:hypothetical protein n=1 Tax=Sphingomonas sp. ID1715 TaxID=1656898 RepID=UPI0017CDD19C|nr:hypothetical protein [Sphingomonas sp. ID1715]NNM78206.1 hypothetical protein [Sphingomonas sp. ID1715]